MHPALVVPSGLRMTTYIRKYRNYFRDKNNILLKNIKFIGKKGVDEQK